MSPFLKHVIYPAVQWSGCFPLLARKDYPTVITYHGVLPSGYKATDAVLDGAWVTAESFRQQLRLLRSNYELISPEQLRLWCRHEEELPERAVLITCDDGLLNNVTEMLPIMVDERVSGLFFITAESLSDNSAMLWHEELYLTLMALPKGFIEINLFDRSMELPVGDLRHRQTLYERLVVRLSAGQPQTRLGLAKSIREKYNLPSDCLSRYLEEHPNRFRILRPSEIHQLLANGMTVGSHTLSHPKLSLLPSDIAWSEILESRNRIQTRVNTSVWSIAYPYGGTDSVSMRELQMAEQAGYDCAFVNFEAESTFPFALPRVHVTLDMNIAEFEARISGLHRALRRSCGVEEKIPDMAEHLQRSN